MQYYTTLCPVYFPEDLTAGFYAGQNTVILNVPSGGAKQIRRGGGGMKEQKHTSKENEGKPMDCFNENALSASQEGTRLITLQKTTFHF